MRPTLIAAALTLVMAVPAVAALEISAEIADLEKDGEKWFKVAGNTDLTQGARNDARKKAYVALWKAKEGLEKAWEGSTSDRNRLEDRLQHVGHMLFWIRKESPIGLLESTGVGPKANLKKQLDWGDKPPPEKKGYAPGEDPGGKSKNPFDEPAKPGEAKSTGPTGPDLEGEYLDAEKYQKEHRADTPGILARWELFLATHSAQIRHALYVKAVEYAGAARSMLKEVYRNLREDDPESVKGLDSGEMTRTIMLLGRDLKSKDSAVRERSARMMGTLGSAEGVYKIVSAFKKEKEPQAAEVMLEAVVKIGGRKAAATLGKLRSDNDKAPAALGALVRMLDTNPVDRGFAIREIGPFAKAKNDEAAALAVETLIGLGPDGAHGLILALSTKNSETKVRVIEALGATGNPQAATPLSSFLIKTDREVPKQLREAARAAITAIGEPAVPYLIEGLKRPHTRLHTGLLLREITEEMIISKPGPWMTWWKKTHPEWRRK